LGVKGVKAAIDLIGYFQDESDRIAVLFVIEGAVEGRNIRKILRSRRSIGPSKTCQKHHINSSLRGRY
jgi:hypothetical protein